MWSSGGAWHASVPACALPLFWATQQLYYYVWYLDKMPTVSGRGDFYFYMWGGGGGDLFYIYFIYVCVGR